jgi:hypothetical protein
MKRTVEPILPTTKGAKPCAFELVEEENGESELYVVYDGRRIAKRGQPDSPQAKTWISIEPGYEVFDRGKRGLTIKYFGVSIQ